MVYTLAKSKCLNTLDLANGFQQLEEDPKYVLKTVTPLEIGHFEFFVISFGLKNAPSTFQCIIDSSLLSLQPQKIFVYMDDNYML